MHYQSNWIFTWFNSSFSTSVVGIYYSAKTLFRFFEETANAAVSLVYPAAVRALESKNFRA